MAIRSHLKLQNGSKAVYVSAEEKNEWIRVFDNFKFSKVRLMAHGCSTVSWLIQIYFFLLKRCFKISIYPKKPSVGNCSEKLIN